MKKFFSFGLTICLLISFISTGLIDINANALVEGHFTYTVTNGEAKITSSSQNIGGSIRIPSTLGGYPVTSIGSFAFKGRTGLSSITISEGIEHISSFAFDGCTGLKNIEIPSTIKSIDSFAFDDCTKLNAVYTTDISNWCKITFETLESNPLYYAHNLYLTNYSLVSDVVIPEEITIIRDYTFSGCSSIKNITMHNKITTIGNSAFLDCIEIESITIPSSVSVIDESAFSGCIKLKTIIIPENVTSISNNTFSGCSSIKNIIMHNKITSIGNKAFFDCIELEDITIPDSVSFIDESAFSGCTKLRSITIPKNTTSISNSTFSGCSSIKNIIMHNKITSIGNKAFNGCVELENITIPDGVLGIGESAFEGCIKLEKITIPRTVTNIGKSAFSGCASLNSINLPFIGDGTSENANFGYIFGDYFGASNDYVPSTLESVVILNDCDIEEYAFYDCKSLVSITLPTNVSYIADNAFAGCTNLANITIPDSLKSIGKWSFSDCASLTNITIPKSIDKIDEYAFYKCTALEKVHISDLSKWCLIDFQDNHSNPLSYGAKLYLNDILVTELIIPNNITEINSYTFQSCMSLKSVKIHSDIIAISQGAFYGCDNLETITVPFIGSSKDENKNLGYIFTQKSNTNNSYISNTSNNNVPYSLKFVEISDGCTSIDGSAFIGCKNIENIIIPNSVTYIGYSIFNNCSAFNACTSLTLKIDINNTYAIDYAENWDLPYITFGIKRTSAPTKVTTSLYGHNDIKLSWSKVADADGYYIYYKKSTSDTWSVAINTKATEYKFANLSDNTTYDFKVETYKIKNNEILPGNSKNVSCKTAINLSAPTTLTVKLENNTSASLNWSKVSGAAKYKIYYRKSTSSDYTYKSITSGLSYKFSGLASGTKYIFKIIPCTNMSGSYVSDDSYKTVSVTTKPNAVSNLKATLYGHDDINLSWSKVAGADGYYIYYKKSTSKTWSSAKAVTNCEYKIKYLADNIKYDFKVESYKKDGSAILKGSTKTTSCYTTRNLSSPSKVTVTLYGYDDVKLSWSKVTYAKAYKIYYKTSSAKSYSYKGTTTNNYMNFVNLSDGVKYYFKVVPCTYVNKTYFADDSYKTSSIYTLKKISTPKVAKYSSGKVKISWTNISGESGYQISQSTSKSKTKIVSTYKTTSGKSKTIKATKGKTYYYKVRAYKTVNGKKIYGAWSSVKAYKLK